MTVCKTARHHTETPITASVTPFPSPVPSSVSDAQVWPLWVFVWCYRAPQTCLQPRFLFQILTALYIQVAVCFTWACCRQCVSTAVLVRLPRCCVCLDVTDTRTIQFTGAVCCVFGFPCLCSVLIFIFRAVSTPRCVTCFLLPASSLPFLPFISFFLSWLGWRWLIKLGGFQGDSCITHSLCPVSTPPQVRPPSHSMDYPPPQLFNSVLFVYSFSYVGKIKISSMRWKVTFFGSIFVKDSYSNLLLSWPIILFNMVIFPKTVDMNWAHS